jgi:tetratricopeptide (TPR) repeat protein
MPDQIAERWETQNEAGRRFFGRGDLARAEQAFAAAIREAEQLGAGDLRLATSLANLAQLKLRQRHHDEAERLFRRSLEIRERALGHDHASLVQTVNGLAAVYYARGDVDAAEPLFRRALSIIERRLGAQHPDILTSLNSLARIAFKRSDYAAAGPLLERLLLIKESTVGHDHPESAPILTSLVKVRCAEGALGEAERLARRVVAIRESEQPPSELTLASSLESLADVLSRLGNRDEERSARQRATALRGHPAATAGLMPLSPRNTPQDVFDPHPTPAGLRSKPAPPSVRTPALGDLLLYLPDEAGADIVAATPASARTPIPSPITEMPRLSMDASSDAVMPRRKTPTAAPPPLPEGPRTVEATKMSVEGAGAEIAPAPIAPPRPVPPPPAPVAVTRPPARHYAPKRRVPRERRESTGPRPHRRSGRKMMVALAVLVSAGAAAAAMGRGGVTESRGVTGEPAREFRARPRRAQVARVVQSPADSALTASVRDSVALLLAQPPLQQRRPPVQQPPPRRSPEVNVPARNRRRDPLAQQIEQMLPGPEPAARQAEPVPPTLPAVNLDSVGVAAAVGATDARARMDSATRKDVKPTFDAKTTPAARP